MYTPVTPVSSRRTGTFSPPPSTTGSTQTYTLTPGGTQRLNVVTRLAIEGKAKDRKDAVGLRMYMKLSIPMDSVSPGSTVALFPEENLKIIGSPQVHPLDANSAPYNFSSTAFPLLNDAARALGLPARSSKSYMSVFGLSQSPVVSSSRSSPTSVNGSSSSLPLDNRYTGHILVSGYHVSYVLPREIPPRNRDDDTPIRTSSTRSRRASIGERNTMQFMAALEVMVPYLSKPPRAPYYLSIPIPRCLSNHIRLRMFSPGPAPAQSFASLSSAEDDQQRWEVVTEPHITNQIGKLGRTRSYGEMADDESSDSTSNYQPGGLQDAIQGTFPSSDYIRIRWAVPVKSLDINGEGGRRRVHVAQAKGELTCVVLGKARDRESDKEGIVMRLEQKGTCKDVWFAGVATMLGMDIGLTAKNAEAVLWAPGEDAKWTVTGGRGYTGYDIGPPTEEENREASLEYPDMMESTASPPFLASLTTRHDSASSNTSLLRAPLPADPMPNYSFEGRTNNLTPATTLSSISSAPSDMRSRASSVSREPAPTIKSPTTDLTVHINMNDLIPASKKEFTFTISGTILVIPRSRSLGMSTSTSTGRSMHMDSDLDMTPVILPHFSVHAADHESVTTSVRNDCTNAKLEVYNISGDLRDAQTLKTVLQTGKSRDCGKEGGRIALRALPPSPSGNRGYVNGIASPSPKPRAMNTSGKSGAVQTYIAPARRKREGPAIIPSVKATITPLTLDFSGSPKAYAVRLSLTAPSDLDSPWLEFGLAQPYVGTSASAAEHGDPEVSIAAISIDGVSARYESSTRNKEDILSELDTLNRAGDSEWVAWVKVHVGEAGGQLQVDYVVTHDTSSPVHEGKGKADPSSIRFGVLLPTFTMPVGCLDATIESYPGLSAYTVRSNLSYRYKSTHGYRLLHYSIQDLFSPWLFIETQPPPSRARVAGQSAAQTLQTLVRLLPALLLLLLVLNVGTEFRHMRRSLDAWGSVHLTRSESAPGPVPIPMDGTGAHVETETVFVTTTLTSTVTATSTKRPGWFADTASSPSASTASSYSSSSSSDTISPTARGKATKDVPTPSSQISKSKSKNRPTKTLRPEVPPSSSPRPVYDSEAETDALAPVMDLPWLNVQLHPAAKKAIDTMVDGLGIVWQVFRRVYHYPLDPP